MDGSEALAVGSATVRPSGITRGDFAEGVGRSFTLSRNSRMRGFDPGAAATGETGGAWGGAVMGSAAEVRLLPEADPRRL